VAVPGSWPHTSPFEDVGRAEGRRRQGGVLDRLIEALRAGESRALVVRGEPGMGKPRQSRV